MTEKEFIIQFLPVVMANDIRLQVHSFYEVDGVFNHTNRCPRCCALFILGYEQEMMYSEVKSYPQMESCSVIRCMI